ncbi:MAG: DUF3467 domain-containing protein [Aureispira sp.]|nr:DUF3467 domain-containing protein [Aureispira sp.]
MNEQNKSNEINIELTDEIAEGTYSNLTIISHSNSEFIIDFVRLVPNVPQAKVKSRIIMTPQHAKRLMFALRENLNRFENAHGTIKDADPGIPYPMNFSNTKGQA